MRCEDLNAMPAQRDTHSLSERNVNSALKPADLKSGLASWSNHWQPQREGSGANAACDIISIKYNVSGGKGHRCSGEITVASKQRTHKHKRYLQRVPSSVWSDAAQCTNSGRCPLFDVLTRVVMLYHIIPAWGCLEVFNGDWSRTEVAPCVALTPVLHLSDVEPLFLLRLFRVATTTGRRERAPRDVPPPPPPPPPLPHSQHPSAGGWMDYFVFHRRISWINTSVIDWSPIMEHKHTFTEWVYVFGLI